MAGDELFLLEGVGFAYAEGKPVLSDLDLLIEDCIDVLPDEIKSLVVQDVLSEAIKILRDFEGYQQAIKEVIGKYQQDLEYQINVYLRRQVLRARLQESNTR